MRAQVSVERTKIRYLYASTESATRQSMDSSSTQQGGSSHGASGSASSGSESLSESLSSASMSLSDGDSRRSLIVSIIHWRGECGVKCCFYFACVAGVHTP